MLESIETCPMCNSTSRTIRFLDVPDFVFFATNELWTIAQCNDCQSVYLTDRPGPDAIGSYYNKYYTHEGQSNGASISGISIRSSIAQKLANSWRNFKYGSDRLSYGKIGALLIWVAGPLRRWIDAECRHLPIFSGSARPLRVLDVGHGDARFIKFAREVGCEASGLEIDPKAVAQAMSAGLDVYEGDINVAIQVWGESHFDYITLSHVIEHVHHPLTVFESASKLLKVGGTLWIECPNPLARGFDVFGPRWRDLDPPRHLCIPSMHALCEAALKNGLVLDRVHRRPFVPFEVYPFSARSAGLGKWRAYSNAFAAEVLNKFYPQKREWLTVSFIKSE